MLEVVTEAIVLDKEPFGEQDSRIFLYTKELGKVSAKATSARKIQSKLAPHLETTNLITARLVAKIDLWDARAFQLADALAQDTSMGWRADSTRLKSAIETLQLINWIVPELVPDISLWDLLKTIINGKSLVTTAAMLGFLGFNSSFAVCELCNRTKPDYFLPKNLFYICKACGVSARNLNNQFVKIDY